VRFLFRSLLSAILLLGLVHSAAAQGVWREEFESAETSWREAGGDVRYKLDSHARVAEGAHSGRWCERIRVTGDNGSTIYLSHEVGPARVIDELAPSVWVKSDHPGLQVLARISLPRSRDPKTGQPLTALISGSGYTQVGSWQQLSVENLARQIDRQVRVLRTQFGPSVDGREAYVDRVVLNIYGGRGTTTVWIDDLELAGVVAAPVSAERSPERPAEVKSPGVNPQRPPIAWQPPTALLPSVSFPEVKLSGSLLLVGGKPFFPRMIQHRGEPLELLKRLGFNAVRLSGPATDELLAAAARLGIWLVAGPPLERSTPGDKELPLGKITSRHDAVLAWDLGQNLSTRELEGTRRLAQRLRAADPRSRPLVADADCDLRSYSRLADVLITHRYPLGSSEELSSYAGVLRQRSLLARPGTPMWTVVQTQPAASVIEQLGALYPGESAAPAVQSDQIRLLVHLALAAGVRGMCFESQSPLDATDPATRMRAIALELQNMELEMIEPWSAAGSFVSTAAGSEPHLSGAVLQNERARLMLPLWSAPSSQFVMGSSAASNVAFIAPGVPESTDAYDLTSAGLQPLIHKRVAGGIRINVSDGQRGAILLTQDPLVLSALSRRTVNIRTRGAQLEHELAAAQLAWVSEVEQRLEKLGKSSPASHGLLSAAEASLQKSKTALTAGDLRAALAESWRCGAALKQIARAEWEGASSKLGSPVAAAAGTNFGTLPLQWRLLEELSHARPERNQLPAGDFENLDVMLKSGWRHFQHPQNGVGTNVELTGDNAHGGRFS